MRGPMDIDAARRAIEEDVAYHRADRVRDEVIVTLAAIAEIIDRSDQTDRTDLPEQAAEK